MEEYRFQVNLGCMIEILSDHLGNYWKQINDGMK